MLMSLQKFFRTYALLLVPALLLPLGCAAEEPTADATSQSATENAIETATTTETSVVSATTADGTPVTVAEAPATVFIEGQHYNKLPNPEPSTGDIIPVIEFFWFGCPTCNAFEPHIQRFNQQVPAGASFEQIPGAANPVWEIHARVFYTAEVLGVSETINPRFFDAIHKAKRNLRSEREIRQFFMDNGVTEDDFDNTFNSFAVNTKIRMAKRLANQYGVQGVPTVVVNGTYTVSPSQAGGFTKAIEVIEFLIDKEKVQ